MKGGLPPCQMGPDINLLLLGLSTYGWLPTISGLLLLVESAAEMMNSVKGLGDIVITDEAIGIAWFLIGILPEIPYSTTKHTSSMPLPPTPFQNTSLKTHINNSRPSSKLSSTPLYGSRPNNHSTAPPDTSNPTTNPKPNPEPPNSSNSPPLVIEKHEFRPDFRPDRGSDRPDFDIII
eukprot:gene3577-7111_t